MAEMRVGIGNTLSRCRRYSLAPSSRRSSTPYSTLVHIQKDLRQGRSTSTDVCEEWLKRIKNANPTLQSFLHINEDSALRQASEMDRRIASEPEMTLSPLAGIPISIKDNICTRGIPTTAASRILEGYCPTYDATVIEKLKAAGAIIMGKTNLDEFGMGSSTENSGYSTTKNPWDIERVPGGSSGGGACAVAAGQSPISLGSDTGGSIRQPAHFCGCVGLKPSYGRVSRFGLISYGSSLDTIGPLAQTVKDAAMTLQIIAGHDKRDATSVDAEVPDYVSDLKRVEEMSSQPLQGKRIAVVSETMGEGVDGRILEALQTTARHLHHLGAVVEEVSIKDFEIGLPSYYIIALSEASSNLSRYDGMRYGIQTQGDDVQQLYMESRMDGLGPEVKRRILMGTYALSAGYYDAYYKRAQQVRSLVTRELNTALDEFDALLTPASPTMPWKIGVFVSDPLATYKSDLMSVACNLAGLPALVLPVGTTDVDGRAMPIGMQLIGRSFGEKSLIDLAHTLEQTLAVYLPVPEIVTQRT